LLTLLLVTSAGPTVVSDEEGGARGSVGSVYKGAWEYWIDVGEGGVDLAFFILREAVAQVEILLWCLVARAAFRRGRLR